MAASDIELWCDIVNNKLVQGITENGTPFSFNKVFQGNRLPFKVFFIKPIPGAIGAPFYSLVAIDSLTMRMTVGPRAGAENILAYQDVWTSHVAADDEGKSQYFYATLDLNTTELNAAIASADTYATYMEIEISEGGNWRTVAQDALSILSVVRGPTGASALPTAAINYPTWAEANNTFVKKIGADGDRIILRAGAFNIEIKANADGSVDVSSSPA